MTDSLHAQQVALALHLRDPQRHAPPADIEPRRLAVYRALFFDNVAQLMASHFPVLHATLDGQAWHALLRAFCAEHRARTPLFPRVGGEFVRFLQQRDPDAQRPWLAELAHYETIELELQIDDAPLPPHAIAGRCNASARPGSPGRRQRSRPACWGDARPTARCASRNWRR
jgi:uncharacterized protein